MAPFPDSKGNRILSMSKRRGYCVVRSLQFG
nr:MAG TPA: hypothetical protein [Caudoviricetes sp.]